MQATAGAFSYVRRGGEEHGQSLNGAVTGYLTDLASDEQLKSQMFWSMDSLACVSQLPVMTIAPLTLLGLLLLLRQAVPLYLIALGPPCRCQCQLITPDRFRRRLHRNYRLHRTDYLAPHAHSDWPRASTLDGLERAVGARGILLMLADLGARSLALSNEIFIGILIITLGGPFFLWLFARRRSPEAS